MKLSVEQLALMRLAFIAECVKRGKDARLAAEYFAQRAVKEGWV